jgi:pimeloyl-ACP methyl ester carboxylesterase
MMPFWMRAGARISQFIPAKYRRPAMIEAARRRRSVFPNRADMLRSYRGRGAFRTWPEDIIRDYIEGGTKLRNDGQVELACAPAWEAANFNAQGHNPFAALSDYNGPMALLYAARGSTCFSPAAKRIADRGGETRVLRVEDATHFLPMEFPDLVRCEIIAFSEHLVKV